jgi:serine/threonine protein kinase
VQKVIYFGNKKEFTKEDNIFERECFLKLDDRYEEGAKEFIQKLMNMNPKLRYSAEDALKDKWLSKLSKDMLD